MKRFTLSPGHLVALSLLFLCGCRPLEVIGPLNAAFDVVNRIDALETEQDRQREEIEQLKSAAGR
tara:strand:+ start:1524 stop:1718 length:195 start_codon:yes stop_codon:yes gene_type:complete